MPLPPPMNDRMRHMPLGRAPVLVISLTLVIFAVAIGIVTNHVRGQVREQIINRDGEVLHAVALMLQMEQAEDFPPDDPATQFNVLLKTSRMKGVIATRLFDGQGRFVAAFPVYVTDAALDAADLDFMGGLRPRDRFHPQAKLEQVFFKHPSAPGDWTKTAPMLEVMIPIHTAAQQKLLGVAQFFIDGQSIAAEFAALDRNLYWQALVIFFTGSVLIFLSLNWAFRRLVRARQQLRERTKSLLEANQELALATKTSAIGAVSTHLLHELKSQIFGLQGLLSYPDAGADAARHRQTAAEATRRMQSLINQVLDVLRSELGTTRHYEISLHELVEIVTVEVAPMAQAADVQFEAEVEAEGTLSSRVANLVIIILINLVQNAIQATPRRKTVRLVLTGSAEQIECCVRDEGTGFPPELLGALFKPGHTTKEGGSGIGLALSKQLASHLGAELELRKNTRGGCLFALTIPDKLIAGKTVLMA
jgi:signal transduction histidine kinase